MVFLQYGRSESLCSTRWLDSTTCLLLHKGRDHSHPMWTTALTVIHLIAEESGGMWRSLDVVALRV
jgi:hypothetical protein